MRDAQHLHSMISNTSDLAEKVSSKVRLLDEVKVFDCNYTLFGVIIILCKELTLRCEQTPVPPPTSAPFHVPMAKWEEGGFDFTRSLKKFNTTFLLVWNLNTDVV